MLGFCGFGCRGVEETFGEERSALVGDGLGVVSDTEVVGSVGLTSLETDEGEIPGEDLVNSGVWGIDEDKSATDVDRVIPVVAKVVVRVDDNRGVFDSDRENIEEGLVDVVTAAWLSADEDKSVTDGDEVILGEAKVVVRVDDNRSLVDVVTVTETNESWGAEDSCPVTLA